MAHQRHAVVALAAAFCALLLAAAVSAKPLTYKPTDCEGILAAIDEIGAVLSNATKPDTVTAVITLDCNGTFNNCSAGISPAWVYNSTAGPKKAPTLKLAIKGDTGCNKGDARKTLAVADGVQASVIMFQAGQLPVNDSSVDFTLSGVIVDGTGGHIGVNAKFNSKSVMTLTDVDVKDCTANGVYLEEFMSLKVTNGVFSGNLGFAGGGAIQLVNIAKSVSFTNSAFINNAGGGAGGAIAADGVPSVTCSKCNFTNNTAPGFQGNAIYLDNVPAKAKLSVTASSFSANGAANSTNPAVICAEYASGADKLAVTLTGSKGLDPVKKPKSGWPVNSTLGCDAALIVQT